MDDALLPMHKQLNWLNTVLYSDGRDSMRHSRKDDDSSNFIAKQYLEASFAANLPSFPLSDPFIQAGNYKGLIYLCIQHFFKVFTGATVGLERQKDKSHSNPAPGARSTDQDYVPVKRHPLLNILRRPNPADTFAAFLCQVTMNWHLHGRVLVWGVPNNVGAPERLYCLPVPLCTPAYNIGSGRYPLGAWRIQQYYPSVGLSGILPTGLAGMAGAVIDAREIYEIKNPHPIYRWAPYSSLFAEDIQLDLTTLIDRSFWSIMTQGIAPRGILDMPGADDYLVKQVQAKISNEHGGADNHGKQLVIGGGDPERPALRWSPFIQSDGSEHAEGWNRYAGFIAAVFGLDLSVLGINKQGGFAERWAAKQDAREGTYDPFLSMIAEMLTNGAVRQWGLMKKGVRCTITLPKATGYEPDAMSRDMASDNTGDVNEIRALRGLPPKPDGDIPPILYLEVLKKKLGLNEQPAPQPGEEGDGSSSPQGDQPPDIGLEQNDSPNDDNDPEKARPDTPKDAKGSLGGEGNGAPKPGNKMGKLAGSLYGKSFPELDTETLLRNVMSVPVLVE